MNIPAMPEELTFTDEQWTAIWAKGKDLLVSAAAGSGKTKVLITRMIEKVIEEENPIDVDQLLVVTFTDAAAAEMRHRMATALEETIEKNPDSIHLRRQLNLLNKAQISTLHSFCQNVVRQYAYMLEIDPGFRVANSTEAALLRDDAIAEVLEEAYSSENPEAVYRLADSFSRDRNDQAVEVLVSELYDYSRVHPQPKKWLLQIPSQYEIENVETIDDLNFIDPLKVSIRHSLEEAAALTGDLKRIALMPEGPEPLAITADNDLFLIEEAIRRITEESWEETYEFFNSVKFGRAAAVRKDSCDEALGERAKAIRKAVKDRVEDVRDSYFIRPPARLLEEIQLMAPLMHTLVDLVLEFGKRYEALKIERGIVDFSDLEHYALQILSKEKEGKLVPSDIALDYQQRFEEVLIDEYQDVNLLQEALLGLVKKGSEKDGNLFMVGDVKQSIYGFRLAEPQLFLSKYNRFSDAETQTGMKIDLNANFRSRKEVLDATNFIFSQIMGERVGEISYDDAAALKYGAQYSEKDCPAELTVLYKDEEDSEQMQASIELKNPQAEALWIAKKIKSLIESDAEVTDAFTDEKRPLEYRDIVILMRSLTWSEDFVEAFKLAGIPIYADISKGYFEALEVMIMLNTLRVIDNPYQDIPLASVLRAPFIGMTEAELAQVRLASKDEPYYEALKRFVATGKSDMSRETEEKLERFFGHFESWRDLARRGSLSELIWQVYTDTNYYEMVGTMSNGKQRQANLRALHDRAIDYESTSFRGVFKFLRFIDRMRKRGDDFGEAKSLSEKENVVRLMTIHSSKGLEFPYVFVPGLGRQFNKQDFNEPYLFDQYFGLAVKAIDPDNRIMYTSLPFLAMKEKKELEMRAEEMRVLYVAMTRAKERLFLVASVKDIEKEMMKWQDTQLVDPTFMLPEFTRSKANRYLDWIGPAIARHTHFEKFELLPGGQLIDDPSKWEVNAWPFSSVQPTDHLIAGSEVEAFEQEEVSDESNEEKSEELYEKILSRFNWTYPYLASVKKRSKQTVSELKRLSLLEDQEEGQLFESSKVDDVSNAYLHSRPQFMQKRTLSPAEVGTAMHTVMQHIDFHKTYNKEKVHEFVKELESRQLLTAEERAAVSEEAVVTFFSNDIAKRLVKAEKVMREVPFTYAYDGDDGDYQILQGIADCLFKEPDGWVLLDYKTDKVQGRYESTKMLEQEMQNRYEIQLNLYRKAIESILKINIKEMVLYLFDGERTVHIQEAEEG